MSVWAAATRRAEAGLPVFNLSAGQPSFPAPTPVRAALHRALDHELLGYTETAGILPLRRAISRHYSEWYQLDVDPDEVVVTTGSSSAFVVTFLAAFDPGARVGMAVPCYPAYRNILEALGCTVVPIRTGPEDRYQPTVEQLEKLALDGLVIASPANPTGTMVSPAELARITSYCVDRGIRLVSDELYHGISYTSPGACAWSTSRRAIVINSFSKYFCMTGWRLGWVLIPEGLRQAVLGLGGNLAICPPAPAQFAALAAFDAYDELDTHVVRYAANRRLMLDRLADLGLTRLAPADGAFYVYADISDLTADAEAWCKRLLDEQGVAVAPGIDFDPGGPPAMRLCFAGDTAVIDQGLTALGRFLG
jgi:aspartate/methionine/tyrosine aminotransferase